MNVLQCIGIILVIIIGFYIAQILTRQIDGFTTHISELKHNPAYKKQLELISKKYDAMAGGKRDVTTLLQDPSTDMAPAEQSLVNFYSLGCRFAGYLGPFDNGFFDAQNATRTAVQAGCRTFVLEIDYADGCYDSAGNQTYFPKLVVRDFQNKSRVNDAGYTPICNTEKHSNIRDVCQAIRDYAFAASAQNATDPVIIVLYVLRLPPKQKATPRVQLDFMSNIAKGLAPLLDKHVDNILYGGTFTRQKQEGRLLINPITDYNGRVLIFCNLDTTPFRDTKPAYTPKEDLDYLVNLRLVYNQTKLGATCNLTGGSFGILSTAEDFLIIPSDQVETAADNTKLRWTICLSQNPATPVPEATYKTITSEFGVHCVPICLWDDKNTFMFTPDTFKTYSFMPKPEELRYVKPPVQIPAEPAPDTNANGGMLRQPTVQGQTAAQ